MPVNVLLPDEIERYVENHTSPESQTLQELNRETYLKILMPNMISGHVQGAFLRMVSQMIRPQKVLEVGTYTGYSAICLAAGLSDNGLIYSIDKNEELEEMAQKYIEKAGLESKVKLLVGDALEIIPTIDDTFDLVFMDADKVSYAKYYEMVFDKVRKGGYILADNVLWKGKVADESMTDKETEGLRKFNELVQNDPRVENVMLSIRDGLMLVRKLD